MSILPDPASYWRHLGTAAQSRSVWGSCWNQYSQTTIMRPRSYTQKNRNPFVTSHAFLRWLMAYLLVIKSLSLCLYLKISTKWLSVRKSKSSPLRCVSPSVNFNSNISSFMDIEGLTTQTIEKYIALRVRHFVQIICNGSCFVPLPINNTFKPAIFSHLSSPAPGYHWAIPTLCIPHLSPFHSNITSSSLSSSAAPFGMPYLYHRLPIQISNLKWLVFHVASHHFIFEMASDRTISTEDRIGWVQDHLVLCGIIHRSLSFREGNMAGVV